MATSGTFASFSVGELLEEAFERAGLELKSGYDLRTGIRSFNFLMAEWANRGLNLWTIEEGTQALTAGDASYDMPAQTIDLIDAVLRDAADTDITLERISSTQYAMLPTKQTSSRPTSYTVSRGATTTSVKLWPIPDDSYTFVYWRLRRLQQAGSIDNDPDVPFRFIPALAAGLAYHIAAKKNPALAGSLKVEYEMAFQLAADEDRDRASVFFFPDVT